MVTCSLRGATESLSRALTLRMALLPLVCCLALGTASAQAQSTTTKFKAADTSSPRDTLRSFIDACNELHQLVTTTKYLDRNDPVTIAISDRVLDCLDDSEIPAFFRTERAGEAAACLKEILDRVELPAWEEIPDTPEIVAAGGTEALSHYRIPDTRVTISKVEQGPRRHEYLFSPGTVDRVPRYYQSIESRPYRTDGPPVSKDFYRWYVSAPGNPWLGAVVTRLPERIQLGRTFGLANWKWPGLIVSLLIAIALMTLAYRAYLRWTEPARARSLFAYWMTLGLPVAAMVIPIGFKHVAYRYLTLRSWPLYINEFMTVLVAMLAALVVVFATSNRIAASVIATPSINPAGLNAQLIRIVSKIASLVAAVALLLVGGQYLGIPVATLLASAGIGGLAVALGAQDTLKTLFGTLNILTDKPFRVGDRIIFDTYDGVVEDIGLRTSRIRLLNGNQVSLPNDQLAGNDIENVGRRSYIRRVGQIHVPLDTTCGKVQQAVEIIREQLEDHEGMDASHPPRVYLDEFTTDAFSIQFYYWYSPPDFWKFKAFGDKLNFSIFRRFEEAGIQFSLPSRHSFWKHDDVQGPLDVNLQRDGIKA
jgi:MscS family membrane protein